MNRGYPYPFVGAARGGGGGGGGGFVPKGFTSLAPNRPAPALQSMRPPPMPGPRPGPRPAPVFRRGGGGFWPWWGWGGWWPWGYSYYQQYQPDVCVTVRNAYLAWRQASATGNAQLAASYKAALDGVLATSSCPARGAYFAWQQAAQAGIQPLAENLRATFESILYQGTSSYTPSAYPYYSYGSPFGFPYGGYPLGSMQVIRGFA